MDEIQRWRRHTVRESEPMIETSMGVWCDFGVSERWHLADKKAALAAQAEEHRKLLSQIAFDRTKLLNTIADKHAKELAEKNKMHMSAMQAKDQYYIKKMADARGEGTERLEYIARDLARLLLVSARADITEFRMNRSTYAWLVERANA